MILCHVATAKKELIVCKNSVVLIISYTIYYISIGMTHYTYKFRLYPNKNQQILLSKHFGCVRFIYNQYLNQRIDSYVKEKKSLNYYDNANNLVQMKKELTWLTDVNAQSLQHSLKCLEGAYGNFFKRKAQFPKFKNKKGKQSFCCPQNSSIENGLLYIIKFKEGIKIDQHRKIEGKIKHVTISKNQSGQYFACVLVEKEIIKLPKNNKEVGIDLGIKDLATCSDGTRYKNIKPYKNLEKQLVKLSRRHSKKKKGSKNREKARVKLAKLHNKIANTRNNHLHQISHRVVRENQLICLEDLNISGMLKNHCLAKSISDVSLSELVRQIQYKAEWYGRDVIIIDRWYPSSKMCNNCNYIKQDLTLKDRYWICCACNAVCERDINAARNILAEGKRLLREKTVGITGLVCGEESSGSLHNVANETDF